MFNLKATIVDRPPSAEKIFKNVQYGTAVGLTKTAKEGQNVVQGAVKGFFNYRNNWLPQSNRFGIRVKSATRSDLTSEVRTMAGWLAKQRIGGNISAGRNRRTFPYTFEGREYIARPSRELRPKGSKKVLTKKLWPSSLKNPFVIRAKNKKNLLILAQRYGPGKNQIAAMYILDEVINIKPKDAFYEPINKVVKRRLSSTVEREIQKALANIK